MREAELQDRIREFISQNQLGTFFRANIGESWIGNRTEDLPDGSKKIYNPRRFRTGLPTGFPDLFGLQTIVITPEMVGQRIAVFAGLEVKTPTGRVRQEQQHMIDYLINAGARAGIVRSIEDVNNLLGR